MTGLPESGSETLQNGFDVCVQSARQDVDLNRASPIVQAYIDERTDVGLCLRWSSDERPRTDICVRFHRSPLRRVPKSEFIWIAGDSGGVLAGTYQMEMPMLVGVVPGVQPRKPNPGPEQVIVPSYIWLKVSDSALIPQGEVFDPVPSTRIEVGDSVEDREQRGSFDLPRYLAAEMPNMKLIRQMIKGRTKVEKDLPQDQRPFGIDGRQIVEVEAVLQSLPVFFSPDGPGLRWRPRRFNLLLEGFGLALCPAEFGVGTIQ